MTSSLEQLFINDVPLIDVRAPVEFARGAFPNAINLPILNDEERKQVGICYKESGPESAVSLGHDLVSGDVKTQRVSAWLSQLEEHPDSQLYCFRGGQRSRIAYDWIKAEGIDVPRIEGGYKKLRSLLLSTFEDLPPITLLSGQTGCGKTRLLKDIARTIDLEALANHRGSAFGGTLEPQPSQIDFENALAIAFLKHGKQEDVVIEDEGRLIGRIHLPTPLQVKMKQSPIAVVEASVEERTLNIFNEYIVQQWQIYQDAYGDDALERFSDYLLTAIDAVRKRLGGVNHVRIRDMMESALRTQSSDLSPHQDWIKAMLIDYYDPMYNYQLSQKAARVVFRGTGAEVANWTRQQGFAA